MPPKPTQLIIKQISPRNSQVVLSLSPDPCDRCGKATPRRSLAKYQGRKVCPSCFFEEAVASASLIRRERDEADRRRTLASRLREHLACVGFQSQFQAIIDDGCEESELEAIGRQNCPELAP